MSRLSDLEPTEPVVRYERDALGDLLHIDTKKLGRIHRVTGNRRDSVDGAGWPVSSWGSNTHSPGRIDHRPMARLNASSSQPCASGPTAERIRTQPSVPRHWRTGSITTTAIARTAVLLASRRSPGWHQINTTSCSSSTSPCGSTHSTSFSCANERPKYYRCR